MRLGLGIRQGLFPIATFFEAGADEAGLEALFDDEGGAALRARLSDGFVRRGEIAFRIAIAAVEDAAAALAGHALDKLAGAALGTMNAQRFRADVDRKSVV